jgi:flavin reductase (DIM6/NTAB) family NADH-FMN oxidoreductase RutF
VKPEGKRMDYLVVSPKEAYSLLSCGGLVLVCTRSASRAGQPRYDLAPIAWSCPLDYEPASRLLFVCDPKHATHENILARREFAVALPSIAQRGMAERSGSCSGRDADKYESLGIDSFDALDVDARVPRGVAGWLECKLLRTVVEGSVSIVMGEVVSARAVEDAWKQRLHFVSEGLYYAPGPALHD